MALTELACKNASCPADRPRLRLTDSAGLYLEVTPADGRYWRRRDCHACKEKRLALGSFTPRWAGSAPAASGSWISV